jgi:hypothetical protein
MRTAGFLVLLCGFLCGVLCLGGCKGKGEADAAPDPAALKAQQDLLSRRDALVAARTKLQNERETVVQQMEDAEAKGSDVTELKKKVAELDSQIESSTTDLISMFNSKLDAIKETSTKRDGLAAREAELAAREKAVADREAHVADREKALVQRDFELAQRWKDSCSVSSAPLIIQQAPPKGGTYTKADVSALVGKAKTAMTKKGLITSDLPGPAQGLESEASKALNDNDMSKAYFAAAQLAATVDSIQINRPFIQAKTARLQAQIKSSKVDDKTQSSLATILADVIQKYNDGDFSAANHRLNQIAGMLH